MSIIQENSKKRSGTKTAFLNWIWLQFLKIFHFLQIAVTWLKIIRILQVGGVLESSGPLLDDGHRDFLKLMQKWLRNWRKRESHFYPRQLYMFICLLKMTYVLKNFKSHLIYHKMSNDLNCSPGYPELPRRLGGRGPVPAEHSRQPMRRGRRRAERGTWWGTAHWGSVL